MEEARRPPETGAVLVCAGMMKLPAMNGLNPFGIKLPCRLKSGFPHHVPEGKVLEPVVRKTTFSQRDSGPVLHGDVVERNTH